MRKTEKLILTNSRGESVEFSHRSIYHTNMNDVAGISDIRNAMYTINSMGQAGETMTGNRIESRDIEIPGSIATKDKGRAAEHRRALNRMLNPNLDHTLLYEYGDFRRVIDCKVDNAPFNRGVIFGKYAVQLVAHNPYWRDETESRTDIAAWVACWEWPCEIPADTGMEFAYRKPELIENVENKGDERCGVRFEFRALGTVVNPSVLNIDTQEFIKVNYTLKAGDVLTVWTHYGNKRVELMRAGQSTNAFRYLDPDSTFMQAEIGDNLYRYDAQSNLEALEISIFHDNLYGGV